MRKEPVNVRPENFWRTARYLFFTLLVSLTILEGILRLFPQLVPDACLMVLPDAVRGRIAAERGLQTGAAMRSRGMLHQYRPHTKFSAYPEVQIDAQGYRNPDLPIENPDVVLLGDSVILALDSPEDIADHLRAQGYSALNLAMVGYSPFHSRDAYREYVYKKGLKPQAAVLFLNIENDLEDNLEYEHILRSGADYRDYLNSIEETAGGPDYPWVFSILQQLPDLVSRFRWKREIRVKLPHGEIKTYPVWWVPPLDKSPEMREMLEKSLRDLSALTRQTGTRLVICLLPTEGVVLAAFDSRLEISRTHYLQTAAFLKEFSRTNGAEFLDLEPGLRAALQKEPVYLSGFISYFNEAGVRVLARLILPAVRRSMELQVKYD